MKKICVICPWGYPVPATKGGAVETLTQFLVEENERDPHFLITLLTTADEEAAAIAHSYTYTKYIGFRSCERFDKCWYFVFRIIKKMFKAYIPASLAVVQVLNYLKRAEQEYDYILLECGQSYMLPQLARIVTKEKIIAHLHWPGDGNKRLDAAVGNIAAVSEYIAGEWKAATGCNSTKLHVWQNCYNDIAFHKELSNEEKKRLREDLGLGDERIIIYTGRIVEGKGVLELIQAFNSLPIDDIALLLIGKANFGKEGQTLFEVTVQRELARSDKKVVALGFIKNDELYKYYSISTLMVAPSKLQESALMVNIEAMSTGTPIISTKMGAISEYVADAGVLVNVDSNLADTLVKEINRLLSDQQLLDKYSNKARKRAKQFTRRKYFERFMEIINEIESFK